MLRLGLSFRIIAIACSFLLVSWLSFVALFYWSNGLQRSTAMPTAERLKAIVALFLAAPPEERYLVENALESSTMTLTVIPEKSATIAYPELDISSQPENRSYFDALDGRLRAIQRLPFEHGSVPPRYTLGAVYPARFVIELDAGEDLLIDTKMPFIVNSAGLPAGLGAGMLGALIAFIAFIILHRELRPMIRLAKAVDRINPMGAPIVLPTISNAAPETRALVNAFERLQTRLHTMIGTRMALIGGIQHDVRSFATRLRLRADMIPDETERNRAIGDITDMIRLLDDALLAGRSATDAMDSELLDFDALIEEEASARRELGRQIIYIGPETTGSAQIIGDRIALRRIVSNIIDNALKFGSKAQVRLRVDADRLQLVVDDDGPGIPADQREAVLEPFVRLEPSRSRSTGGAGLGLAIVANLVSAHGGMIAIEDAPWGGTRISVVLPAFEADSEMDDDFAKADA